MIPVQKSPLKCIVKIALSKCISVLEIPRGKLKLVIEFPSSDITGKRATIGKDVDVISENGGSA